jgi:hypothetical protein
MALGVSFPKIAQELGNITESAARKLGRRALISQAADLRSAESFSAALALHMVRYELLLSVWFPKAMAGDDKAADLVGKYMSQIGDIQGFKTMPRDTGGGDGDEPASADLVKMALDRLEQLHERMKEPATIDGEVVNDDEPAAAGEEDQEAPTAAAVTESNN